MNYNCNLASDGHINVFFECLENFRFEQSYIEFVNAPIISVFRNFLNTCTAEQMRIRFNQVASSAGSLVVIELGIEDAKEFKLPGQETEEECCHSEMEGNRKALEFEVNIEDFLSKLETFITRIEDTDGPAYVCKR